MKLGIPLLFAQPKWAAKGLFAGKTVMHGNQISEMGNKTKRTWRPNVQRCRLYSEILKQKVRVHVTTEALKRIDVKGGLDQYILEQDHPESEFAAKLKERLLKRRLEN